MAERVVTVSGRRALGHRRRVRHRAAPRPRLLRQRGAEVALLDARRDAVSATAAEIGARAALVADVRDEAAVEAALDEATAALGGPPEPPRDGRRHLSRRGPARDERRGLGRGARGQPARHVPGGARRRPPARGEHGLPGAIATLASTAAFGADASEPSGAYSASKAAVLSLTRQMAVEWAPLGIRVNAVVSRRHRHADAAPHGRPRGRAGLPRERRAAARASAGPRRSPRRSPSCSPTRLRT